jgi:hypothetical protein
MIIAESGWGQDSHKASAAEAGFDHHLVKPVDFQALERLIAADWALDRALIRLIGAVLLEQNDEWAIQRARYMTLFVSSRICFRTQRSSPATF